MHKCSRAFVTDILAHVQKMGMDDIDAFLVNELFERAVPFRVANILW